MANELIPKSAATNAYELLEEIERLIGEEPRRYDQTMWKVNPAHVKHAIVPACETICCIAGWVETLKSPTPIAPKDVTYGDWLMGKFGNVAEFARQTLGLSTLQAKELFDASAAGGRSDKWELVEEDADLDVDGFPERNVEDDGDVTPESLREHAIRGIAHIRAFREKYADQLKAKAV